MFYPYHQAKTARDKLNNLRQVATRKNDGFQTYLFKFQNLVVQSQARDTPEVRRLFIKGLDIQITTIIYSMKKVPDILKGWMDKAIDFHNKRPASSLSRKDMVYPSLSFLPTHTPPATLMP